MSESGGEPYEVRWSGIPALGGPAWTAREGMEGGPELQGPPTPLPLWGLWLGWRDGPRPTPAPRGWGRLVLGPRAPSPACLLQTSMQSQAETFTRASKLLSRLISRDDLQAGAAAMPSR